MKILFILIVNLIFYWIANVYKKNHLKKIDMYSNVLLFINDASSQVSFTKSNIFEIIRNNISSYSKNFSNILSDYADGKSLSSIDYLNKNECDEIIEFLNSIGKYDITETDKMFNFYKSKFENKLMIQKDNYKTKVEPIFKIIIVLGLAVSILLI